MALKGANGSPFHHVYTVSDTHELDAGKKALRNQMGAKCYT